MVPSRFFTSHADRLGNAYSDWDKEKQKSPCVLWIFLKKKIENNRWYIKIMKRLLVDAFYEDGISTCCIIWSILYWQEYAMVH
jgi:hypothetical protein